ncbi:apolipoprotein N-acyltransferase [Corynebacterium massiliense]|uniref:Apolipoprotein N-acyltransferase n=1 Tax=Corynebacterium massiliense DSM 45435 TaxID=1121364 RepID=A0ABY7U7E3_9CORY|nr:apolipoprotein N-acyltransferase [Corynebacterium massiliense]WCZ32499.1 Apolipoprotein N-acyltransferase [Corynebacterium massiliense DSM 45435]
MARGWLLARCVLAALAGALTYTAYAPFGWWPAAIAGMGLLYAALSPWPRGKRLTLGKAAWVAFVHALCLYLLLLPWIGEMVGAFPYIALAVFLALYALLLGAGGAALARWRYGFVAFPLWYAAVEVLRSSVPFGGFSWVRLAWSQVEGPLAHLMPWGGAVVVTAATVLVGTSIAALIGTLVGVPRAEKARGQALPRFRATAAAGAIVPLAAAMVATMTATASGPDGSSSHHVGEVRAAAVQGNVPRMGLDFNAQRRAVLANHARVTEELAEAEPDLDLVFWPENSSDVNPFADDSAMAMIQKAARRVAAPVLVGTLTRDHVGDRNTMQVFDADGQPGEYHHKKYLQPFGETMPWRDFFAHFSDFVDLAGDFQPGNGPGVVHMAGIPVGVATCYEVSFDDAFRTSVANGAQILTSPTNNATFGFSDMTYQQLAMSRMRAMETDRAVVVAATSGVSAIVHPDGSVTQQSRIFEPKFLAEDLPLRDSLTPAVRFGHTLQVILLILGVGLTAAAVWTTSWKGRVLSRLRK